VNGECLADCKANLVQGVWMGRFSIAGPIAETFKWGTQKQYSSSTTSTWSSSVTSSVEAGIDIKGFASAKASVGSDIGSELAQNDEQTWTANQEFDFQITFDGTEVGKYVWQFSYNITDTCTHEEHTVTKEYTLSRGLFEPPCCVPGYNLDAPYSRVCYSNETLIYKAGEYNCTVGPRSMAEAIDAATSQQT